MAKIQISINDDLLKRVDEYADQTFNTRSGTISLALNQLLISSDVVRSINTMSLAMQKIADSGEIDAESRKELEDFERLSKMLVNGISYKI